MNNSEDSFHSAMDGSPPTNQQQQRANVDPVDNALAILGGLAQGSLIFFIFISS
jgi:hypothetical protein